LGWEDTDGSSLIFALRYYSDRADTGADVEDDPPLLDLVTFVLRHVRDG
jgi:hypothetical protein